MVYHFIINPINKKNVSIFSSEGKKLLNNYIKYIYGGHVITLSKLAKPLNPFMITELPPWVTGMRCVVKDFNSTGWKRGTIGIDPKDGSPDPKYPDYTRIVQFDDGTELWHNWDEIWINDPPLREDMIPEDPQYFLTREEALGNLVYKAENSMRQQRQEADAMEIGSQFPITKFRNKTAAELAIENESDRMKIIQDRQNRHQADIDQFLSKSNHRDDIDNMNFTVESHLNDEQARKDDNWIDRFLEELTADGEDDT